MVRDFFRVRNRVRNWFGTGSELPRGPGIGYLIALGNFTAPESMARSKHRIERNYISGNRVKLIQSGSEYFDTMLQLINGARQTIHLQIYIFENDQTGKEIAKALMDATKRGVKVYLLVDGYASQVMGKAFIKEIEEAGIHFRFFEPLFRGKEFYFGRRLHHKILAVDSCIATVGGINIGDRYNDLPGAPAWLDFGVRVEGAIVYELCLICARIWKGYLQPSNYPSCQKHTDTEKIPRDEDSKVRVRRNDWMRRQNQISGSYIEIFRNAKEEIIILCSYFLPGQVIRRYMKAATRRGISIKVITTGRSDVAFSKNAERYMYAWMLRNRIQIFEYQKNVLHGKLAVCDTNLVTIGSYNVNDLSAYASIELNLDVSSPEFAEEVKDKLTKIMETDCIQITAKEYHRTTNTFKKLVRWTSYRIIRILLYLVTPSMRKG